MITYEDVHKAITNALNMLDNMEATNKLKTNAHANYIKSRDALVEAAGCATASEIHHLAEGPRE